MSESTTKRDYAKTVNLPRTEFPMKASLPTREPEMQARWYEQHMYRRLREKGKGKPKKILHDGPPYANGDIHMGTALNKILKDMIVKYWGMQGFDSPYVPGWDTHGLPIEHAALKALGLNRRELSDLDLRQQCADYARKYIDLQRVEFKRLGVIGDWDDPYVTLKPAYEAAQIRVFGEMARRGYIYKGLKSVYWCAHCETALAEAEIEYYNKVSPSIYVAFPVTDGQGKLPEGSHVVIWTTTPWTIPANLGIALHPDLSYGLYDTAKGELLLAEELAGTALKAMGLLADGEPTPTPKKTFRGAELEGVVTRHPLAQTDPVFDRPSPLVLGDHVTTEAGTGCVHTAPGHGPEDFAIGQQYGLGVINPVNERGIFTAEAGPFAGQFIEKANPGIIEALNEAAVLLNADKVEHSYAHCWRCKNPVLYRATEQWFASIDGFRQDALNVINNEVKWIPSWGRERIYNMVADRSEWCISRQRAWGVPIPVFYCKGCNEPLITEASVEAVAELFAREGSDAWWRYEAQDILPAGTTCACGGHEFRKETDIMDVWFDSGSSHRAVLAQRPELEWPAEMYLEGSDQHRGWFQSSLLTSVATTGHAPYRSVLTHGFVVDGEGRKMSKSIGNVLYPNQIMKQYGADILRLWVASSDYRADIRISPDILKQLSEVYRKIRNTLRFLLSNLSDFDPVADAVPYGDLEEIDRYMLHELAGLTNRAQAAYDAYEYHVLYHSIQNFCTVDLSAFYLDVLKDRLYTLAPADRSRRAGQTVLYELAVTLMKLLMPVLVHTCDEAWGYLAKRPDEPDTVLLADWPELPAEWTQPELAARWDALLEVREEVTKALEEARAAKQIGKSLEAQIVLTAGAETVALLDSFGDNLPAIFLVSQVTVQSGEGPDVAVQVLPARGEKCPRCWVFSEETGTDPDHPELCPRCTAAVAALA